MVGVESTDSSALPNTGVRGVLQVIGIQTSGSLAFWVSDDLSNNFWGQVGYFISGGGAPIAFFQVWNLNTKTIAFEGSTPTSNGFHTFSMFLRNGTTWDYEVDSSVFGTFDMGANSSSMSYPVYAVSEEQANYTFTFPRVSLDPALEVLRSGSWGLVRFASSYGNAWGIQGTSQNSSLQAGEVTIGGNLSAISPGSTLWSFQKVAPAGATTGNAASQSASPSSLGQVVARKSDGFFART
jgi:hypothetical protein